MCVLIFCTTFIWNISSSKKKWARYDKKVYWSSYRNILYSCPILMGLEFSRQIFDNSSDIEYNENRRSGSRVFPCGWTDGRTDMTKLIVTFRIFANAPKKMINRALYFLVAWYICDCSKSTGDRRLGCGCPLPQHPDIRTGCWNHFALYLLGTNADSLVLRWSEIANITEILQREVAVKNEILNLLKTCN